MYPGKKSTNEERLSAQLEEWDLVVRLAEARVGRGVTSAELDALDDIQDLQSRRDAFRKKLAELRAASRDSWEVEKRESGAGTWWEAPGEAEES